MSEVVIKDFSFSVEPIRFRINDDVFEASPEIGLGVLQDIVKIRDLGIEKAQKDPEQILKVFETFLLERSINRFRERCYSKEEPIGIRHLMAILPWLMEEYGLRPTQPSSPSLNGSDGGETGTSSTGGVWLEESQLPEKSAPETASA